MPSVEVSLFAGSEVEVEFIDEEARDEPEQGVSVRKC